MRFFGSGISCIFFSAISYCNKICCVQVKVNKGHLNTNGSKRSKFILVANNLQSLDLFKDYVLEHASLEKQFNRMKADLDKRLAISQPGANLSALGEDLPESDVMLLAMITTNQGDLVQDEEDIKDNKTLIREKLQHALNQHETAIMGKHKVLLLLHYLTHLNMTYVRYRRLPTFISVTRKNKQSWRAMILLKLKTLWNLTLPPP